MTRHLDGPCPGGRQAWAPGCLFEEIFHEFLWRAGLEGGLPFVPVRVGAWWRANHEIDAVALGQDAALLAECKWSRRPVGMELLQSLEAKADLVRAELGRRKLFFGLSLPGPQQTGVG